jgi:hypothetical protein
MFLQLGSLASLAVPLCPSPNGSVRFLPEQLSVTRGNASPRPPEDTRPGVSHCRAWCCLLALLSTTVQDGFRTK